MVLRRVLALTVWKPGRFGVPADRYASLYRIFLPLFDVGILVAGLGAIVYGSPALLDLSDGLLAFSLGWGSWTLLAGTSALVGLAFPRLLRLEAIGKSAIVASAVVYIGALVILTSGGSTTRFVATGMSWATLLIALWRLSDLRVERQRRTWEERQKLQLDRDHRRENGMPRDA